MKKMSPKKPCSINKGLNSTKNPLTKNKSVSQTPFNDWSITQVKPEDVSSSEINVCAQPKSVHNRKPTPYLFNKKRKVEKSAITKVNLAKSLIKSPELKNNESSTEDNTVIDLELKHNETKCEDSSKEQKKRKRNNSPKNASIENEMSVIPSTSLKDDFENSNDDIAENADDFFSSFENLCESEDNIYSDEDDLVTQNQLDDSQEVTLNCPPVSNSRSKHMNAKKLRKLERINLKRSKGNILNLKGFILLSIKVNTEVFMYGLAKIKVLKGCIEILGCIFNKDSDETEVFSPKGTSVLYIKSLPTATKIDERISLPDELKSSWDFIEEMLNLNDSALILCKKFEPPLFTFINKQIAQNIMPKTITAGSCMFREISEEWNATKKDDSWNEIVNKINFTSKVFICGGKDVGKSTLMRYIVNSLLRKFNEVCVVDLDPGQPEFTVPGCISTTVVTKPLLGPNYTHIRKPDKCLFITNIDVTHETDVYLLNVKELLSISKDLMQLPTIVNYMGYHRAIGLDLVASVINLVQPTEVVQIQSSSAAKNFEEILDVACVTEKSRNLSLHLNNLSYKIVTIPSMADETTTQWVLSARQVRELCVISYFANNLQKEASSFLNGEVPIYTISLSDIELRVENREASLLESNGRLVGLCSLRNSYDITNVYTCHGWGVIRGFDLKTNKLALVTPVPSSILDGVQCLVLGSVNLPPSIYMSQTGVGSIPFVSLGVPQFTSNVPKKKHFS